MNNVIKHPAPAGFFADHFYSVESTTAEGNPFTFGRIFMSKHRRTNLVGVGKSHFYAGSTNKASVIKYAKTVSPDTTKRFHINYGNLKELT